jgi:Raf kinase inhibitor-like YbhB/YbcL family protein
MKVPKKILIFILVVVAIVGALAWAERNNRGSNTISDNNNDSKPGIQIISPAFRKGGSIPVQYTCKGQNVSPPLNILNGDPAVKSLALIMHDPDAPVGDYVHWTMWDIPTSTETIAANSVPTGAIQGLNSNNQNKYMGPCPPSGTHRYLFELYAVDKVLSLPANTTRDQLKQAMDNHILDQDVLIGTFAAE